MFTQIREKVYSRCELEFCRKKFRKKVPWQRCCSAEHAEKLRILEAASKITKKMRKLK